MQENSSLRNISEAIGLSVDRLVSIQSKLGISVSADAIVPVDAISRIMEKVEEESIQILPNLCLGELNDYGLKVHRFKGE